MIEPGLYKHYKGKLYRVLFVAPWWSGQDQLKPNDPLDVVVRDDAVGVQFLDDNNVVFTARWSGNDFARLDRGEPIVIYVALYDDGRVAARLLNEFEEIVDGVPRFERIGE